MSAKENKTYLDFFGQMNNREIQWLLGRVQMRQIVAVFPFLSVLSKEKIERNVCGVYKTDLRNAQRADSIPYYSIAKIKQQFAAMVEEGGIDISSPLCRPQDPEIVNKFDVLSGVSVLPPEKIMVFLEKANSYLLASALLYSRPKTAKSIMGLLSRRVAKLIREDSQMIGELRLPQIKYTQALVNELCAEIRSEIY